MASTKGSDAVIWRGEGGAGMEDAVTQLGME